MHIVQKGDMLVDVLLEEDNLEIVLLSLRSKQNLNSNWITQREEQLVAQRN